MSHARARLLERLRTRAYREGTFTLASGKTSDFFIDCKRVMLTGEGHALCGEALLDELERAESAGMPTVDVVAGVALGGCPLASAVAQTAFHRGRALDALYVRKEQKDHGTKSMVEGVAKPGARVALLEDVMTTGGSSLKAVEQLRVAGYEVALILALVDRREGAIEALASHGVRAAALFAREDFVR
ncbi:MAG: orotate phosphoribosyltransferase [Polyangiales bacterium]